MTGCAISIDDRGDVLIKRRLTNGFFPAIRLCASNGRVNSRRPPIRAKLGTTLKNRSEIAGYHPAFFVSCGQATIGCNISSTFSAWSVTALSEEPIIHNENYRDAILRGVGFLADPLKATLGFNRRNRV